MLRTETGFDRFQPVWNELLRKRRIGEDAPHRVGQRVRVSGRHQQAVFPVPDDFGYAARRGGDDRNTKRHRFQHSHTEPVPQGGENEQVAPSQDGGDILPGAQEFYDRVQSQLVCFGLKPSPFGAFSDRIDRKTVISAGLVIFIAGSVMAAVAQSIYIVICGRALQGAGAIAAAIMALAADLTRDTQRSKAMALIGISIGLSFSLSFVVGPVLNPYIGVPGLFFVSAGLALLAIVILYTLVPVPERHLLLPEQRAQRGQLRAVLIEPQLQRLYISIFILHMLLMSSFVAVPLALRDTAGLDPAHHWEVYLPVLVLSGLIMVPFLLLGEKYNKVSMIFGGAVALMIITQFGLYFGHNSILQITFLLLLFFVSFNYLEATLPALITRYAPRTGKGKSGCTMPL